MLTAMTTVADAAGLAAVYADRLLVRTTRDVHRAIAGRVLSVTGQRKSPVGRLHDAITATVYGGIGFATRTLGLVGRLGVLAGDLEESPRGRRIRSIVNGLIGDVLRDQDSPMAIDATFRVEGHDLSLTPAELTRAVPAGTPRIAVFVHGLCEDDESWAYKTIERGPSYLDQLAGVGRWTPLALRYNSGAPIQHNARQVAVLVDRLVEAWPCPVEEVAFVGHSMGGLLARAAASHASSAWWAERVSHVVLLGSPHSGAPLERLVNRSVPAMRRLPEVAPFAAILDERSIGIRDLHDGIGTDAVVWPQAAYHCVGATLGVGERALTGRMFGDLLVLLDSARGSGMGVRADFRHIPGAHHFDLLNHPEISADLAAWFADQTAPRRGSDVVIEELSSRI